MAQAPLPVATSTPAAPAVRSVQATTQDLQGGAGAGAVPTASGYPGGSSLPGGTYGGYGLPPAAPGVPSSGLYGPGPGPSGPVPVGTPGAYGWPGPGPLDMGAPPANGWVDKIGPGERDYTCDQYRLYGNVEYLLWHLGNPTIPASATLTPVGVLTIPTGFTLTTTNGTTFTQTPTPPSLVSVGAQNGQVASGPISIGDHNGGRLTVGMWCDPDRWLGFEASGFLLEKLAYGSNTIFNNNNGNTNQVVVNTGVLYTQPGVVIPGTATTPNATIIPGATTPIVLLGTSNGALQSSLNQVMAGAEFNARSTWMYFANTQIGFLTGFRYLYFYEDFSLRDTYSLTLNNVTGPGAIVIPGLPTSFGANSTDAINCTNNFYGAQCGVDSQSIFGQFYVQARAQVALGAMRQEVAINSSSFSPALAEGGILFGTGAVGPKYRTQIAAIPEGQLKIGYQFCHYLRAYAGYDVMYVYNVVRPANEIAPGNTVQVNVAGTTNTSNISQNTFRFNSTNIMVQGIVFGLEFRW